MLELFNNSFFHEMSWHVNYKLTLISYIKISLKPDEKLSEYSFLALKLSLFLNKKSPSQWVLVHLYKKKVSLKSVTSWKCQIWHLWASIKTEEYKKSQILVQFPLKSSRGKYSVVTLHFFFCNVIQINLYVKPGADLVWIQCITLIIEQIIISWVD